MVYQGRAARRAKTYGEYYVLQLQDIRRARKSHNDETVVHAIQDLLAAMASIGIDEEVVEEQGTAGANIRFKGFDPEEWDGHPQLGEEDVQEALEKIVATIPPGSTHPKPDISKVLKANYKTAYDALHETVAGTGIDFKEFERAQYNVSGTSRGSS